MFVCQICSSRLGFSIPVGPGHSHQGSEYTVLRPIYQSNSKGWGYCGIIFEIENTVFKLYIEKDSVSNSFGGGGLKTHLKKYIFDWVFVVA